MRDLTDAFLELVRRASTDLPEDVERALRRATEEEDPGSAGRSALEAVLQNVSLARRESSPICQDTPLLRPTSRRLEHPEASGADPVRGGPGYSPLLPQAERGG